MPTRAKTLQDFGNRGIGKIVARFKEWISTMFGVFLNFKQLISQSSTTRVYFSLRRTIYDTRQLVISGLGSKTYILYEASFE